LQEAPGDSFHLVSQKRPKLTQIVNRGTKSATDCAGACMIYQVQPEYRLDTD